MTVSRHVLLSSPDMGQICSQRLTRLDRPGARYIFGLHGHGSNALFAMPVVNWNLGEHVQRLVDEDYIFVGLDAGGPNEWANDNAMTKILQCADLLTDAPFALMGWSMGGLTALNFLKRNPERVLGVLTWAAAVDLEYHWTNGGASVQAELNAAYGGNYQANKAGHDPNTERATYNALAAGTPIRNIHSLDDPTTPWAVEGPFYAACPQIDSITVDGSGHFPFYGYDFEDTVDFYNSLEW